MEENAALVLIGKLVEGHVSQLHLQMICPKDAGKVTKLLSSTA